MSAIAPSFRRPPGPDTPTPLGIDADTLDVLMALTAEHGDIVSVQKPSGRLAYFINDPGELRRLLERRHSRYVKGAGFERVKMLLGNGLIVSDGDDWRRSRTMIQPAFKSRNLHRLMSVMVACSDRCAARWAQAAADDVAINITDETSAFALEVILISIFGADYEGKLLSAGGNPFAFLSEDATRDLGVVLKVRELRKTLLGLIAERRRDGTESSDLMSMYMQARDKRGERFSDEELLDEIFTLIVAGFETSANTLNWAWWLIAANPHVEAKLVDEARRCLPGVDAVSPENLAAMTYTQQVLDETLRLYPPVWLFTRRARDDDVLEDYDIPAGTDVYLSPYVLHRSARHWPDPERFDPDRFAAADGPKKERPYFPFSLGPRRCLGESFAFFEMKLHLGLLLPSFRLAKINDNDPGLDLAINLRSRNDIFLQPAIR